jgi:hypothetical protein
MSPQNDPELFDVLQDAELMELADLLRSARPAEPPLDDAFRSGLRRQLMQKAWEMGEGRPPWWQRLTAPQGLAWGAAAVGVVLIGSVVVYTALQPKGGLTEQIQVTSPIADSNSVKLQQPILVAFNQPMEHASTEAAVQITPATSVSFQWHDNTLEVQPTSGNLAPNTQYQVTIGPGAMTSSGQQIASPQKITFVTQAPQPTPTPAPSPTASPTPGSLVIGEHQLANLGGAGAAPVQWSADSSTVYLVNAKGALESVPAKGGDAKVLVADGTSSPAISPGGDRLAYIRGGKIEVLSLADGSITEVPPPTAATIVGWAKDKLVWAAVDGVYVQGANGPTQLVPFTADSAITVLSIAPDGSHAIYQHDHSLVVLDLATGHGFPAGPLGAQFMGWSPDGTALLYSTADATVVSDLQGQTVASLHPGEASWSGQDGVLVGTDIELFEVHPDGFGLTKLANGTYRAPQWAPNGATFVFFRGGSIWSATAPPPVHEPTPLEQAASVVDSFMKARLGGQADLATSWLDANGKQAYSSGGLSLTVSGDNQRFSRYYILSGEIIQTNPDTAQFVVRLVLTHDKIDKRELEETLTLVRDPASRSFLIDQANAGARRDLGTGAQVVSVEVTATTVKVTFDSDLVPSSVPGGVIVLDAKGKQVDAASTYAKKMVILTGLALEPGAQYKLVVLSTLQDVGGHNIDSEYDLGIVGPATSSGSVPAPAPSPHPSPSPRQSPAPSASAAS